jgi:hypothetical protein
MKRALLLLVAIAMVAGLTGCIRQHGRRPWATIGGSCAQAPENCQSCDDPSGEPCDGAQEVCVDPVRGRRGDGPGFFKPGCHCKGPCRCPRGDEAAAPAGPATGAVTYPYYTTRGPRDFLAKNPPSIGP